MKHLLSIPKEFKQMHIDKFKQYLDEGYEIIEETQVNDFKCYVFEKKFESIVDQLKEEMLVKRIEEVNKVYQDAFTEGINYRTRFQPTPSISTKNYHVLTDEELGRSNACKIKLSEMMGKLINDRK
ncbi:hypothetical protein [Elizabethkingia anophelis]|uniref:hypothetical protein n=1 Tax=Elizabethkingia anophelis TaxID=1117645 RepID=UPI002405F5DD|nr:hypothetical protein [Elizabethkingia anophelis]